MTALRSHIIRLAHQNASLRPHLLQILASSKEADVGPYKKFDRGDLEVIAVPANLSGKKEVDKWGLLIKMKLHDFEPGSEDRKKFLDEAKKQVGYAAFLNRSTAGGKHLKALAQKLGQPELMLTEMD